MAAFANRQFDPPKNYELYTLRILSKRLETEPVFVYATPREGSGCVIENEEDTKFNLSDHIGLNTHKNTLEWGLSGFHSVTKNPAIEMCAGHQRYLKVDLGNGEIGGLNLDNYLALVEYYDDKTGEIRTKLGKKPESSKRSIILCFDGTSNHFSNQNTNVVKLVELLKKDDPSQQMVYYQAGVGTYSSPGFLTDAGQTVAATADEGVAWYLYQHVIDGYRYLMQTYRAGDQVSIFGFSRGAYTARALAGMLHSSKFHSRIKSTQNQAPGNLKDIDPAAFKRTFCIPIIITFLGVWDTVGSVGAFTRKTLPYIEHNPSVRQALALDENRGNFIPSVWDHSKTLRGQSVLEVWFKGGHCDVGGGTAPVDKFLSDDTSGNQIARLSNIPLRWMIRQCLTPGVHILFDPKAMRRYRKHKILEERRPGDEEETYLKDSAALDEVDVLIAPDLMYDEWSLKGWGWWVLDKLPVPKLSQETTTSSQPETVWMPNNGAPRVVNLAGPKSNIRLHASVYTHLQKYADRGGKDGKGYIPAAAWRGWDRDHWPVIEEGNMPSIMLPNDRDSAPLRKVLDMGWEEPEQTWVATPSGTSGMRKDKWDHRVVTNDHRQPVSGITSLVSLL
ncbi:hypothetical protein B0J17DRAFT_718146 [Rhizoctonia solani]|nr:hypothetical protein B0J17DRAFT_718146 [Rhizoctonia solani]